MTLRRARGPGPPKDVVLRVGQAIDERKPLLSLFLTRGDTPEQRAWIGWSPLGPYESSGRDAERLLGWHFNTGKAAAPTRFALADQYRRFHRPGLLKDLIDGGGPVPDPAPPPLLRPNMSLIVDPEGEIDGKSQLLVRRPPSALNLVLLNQNVPTDRVESVRWKIDDAPWGELAPAADGIWSVDLSRVAWQRGEHRVVVSLRTREAIPQEFSEWRAIRFQPPPPILEADPPQPDGKVVVVDRAEFTYRARLTPGAGAGQGPARPSRQWPAPLADGLARRCADGDQPSLDP